MPHFAHGVVKFQRDIYPGKAELFEKLSTGQSPEALFITCSDSRIETAMLTQTDPGELFPWDRLADLGLCLPRPQKLNLGDPFDNDGAFYLALDRFGYDISEGRKTIEAFQRRWRPGRIDGEIDGELGAILFQLLLDRDRGLAR